MSDPLPDDGPGDPIPGDPGYEYPRCFVCEENDPSVILECRDRVIRCAAHANDAGYCWGCGEADPQWYPYDDTSDGLCHDCRSADIMFDRKYRRSRRIGIQ